MTLNNHFTAILNAYAQWLDTLGFSQSLRRTHTGRIKFFFLRLQQHGIFTVRKITRKHLTDYFDYLQTRPNKRTGIGALGIGHLNQTFDAVDKLMEYLHQIGVEHAPLPTAFRLPQDEQARIRKIQPLTRTQIQTLQSLIPKAFERYDYRQRTHRIEQMKLVFVLYYACGLRRKEGINLTIKDLDFDKKTLFVRQGKNQKDRIIPMSENVYRALQDYVYNFRNLEKTGHQRLFIQSPKVLNNGLKKLQKLSNDPAIKSKNLTLHVLRHSIATHLMQNGMNIENICRFLGHQSLESTQVYTHIAGRQE